MHELIEKYFNGSITYHEKQELFLLIERNAELKEEFISLQNLYGMSSLQFRENDRSAAFTKLKEFKQKRSRKSFVRSLKRVAGYAAAICIAILSTWLIMRETMMEETPQLAFYEEFVTPAGQRAMLKLHDGTTVWLNARSSLRYPNVFINGERKVELNGEAFFDVKHDENTPFVVATEKLDIKVLGTQFNVTAYHGRNEFNASLMEGSIKVYNKGNEQNALFIAPKECAELVNNQLVKRSFDNFDFLLWKEGIYAFDDITFTEIIRRLELYYDVTINVANRKVSTYRFTGKFRQRDGVESALRTLQKVYYFKFTKDEENNIITII
ncbi:transmembrane sensor [Parabacteroides sp. PF5-5]|uniref:FecR family protein n=1 Tax=unclassified Parabacteroides TaxID=2649774 RepID=UPI0024733945|nr:MULTISPECIES: FecR domain-containing protein [unclassified Parabacteroides]MDH6304093.1 transmembrane sensor [Parabacteroides sp. PH5-39]MDH6315207.1 transmembrane sensor [Parabacteroides sp. PF5-13]MDH6318852.1 transmembrane sensor [Parabacteroides sp. PH5-13]MDH6322581.1 transmembrane sensor [Parabacteroides sp. PH5-8]MDH6326267.1 transmembrane sensor [Parabacteroides sp. PH5-41]